MERNKRYTDICEEENKEYFGCLDVTSMKVNIDNVQPVPNHTDVSVAQSPTLACTEGVTSKGQNIARIANFMHSMGSCDNLVTLPNLPSSSTDQASMKGHTVQIIDGSTVSGVRE